MPNVSGMTDDRLIELLFPLFIDLGNQVARMRKSNPIRKDCQPIMEDLNAVIVELTLRSQLGSHLRTQVAG